MEMTGNEEFNHDGAREEEEKDESKATKAARIKEELKKRREELMKRAEKKDLLKRFFTERYEAEQEETFIRASEADDLRRLQVVQTQKLGEELMRRKQNDIREQKLRQLMRNDSIELRQLEDQLRKAYSAKDAKIQLLERQELRKNMKLREIENDRILQDWYKDDGFNEQQMLEVRRKKEEYRRDLQEQLLSNQRLRQQKIEEGRLERKLVENTLTLGSQDRENRRGKRERAMHLLGEQRAFLEAQKFRKSSENRAMLKEEAECARITADKMIHENQSKVAKPDVIAAKAAILEKMTAKMLSQEKSKREREEAINELMAEEEKNYLENREREEILEKRQRAKAMLEDTERQKIMKEDSRVREKKIDREFAEYLEKEREKFLTNDKREEEERRIKAIRYGEDQREAITTANLRYAKDILDKQASLERDKLIEEERKKSIEKERSRMLQEHECHLSGFFNSSV